jgi:hypothetical protein
MVNYFDRQHLVLSHLDLQKGADLSRVAGNTEKQLRGAVSAMNAQCVMFFQVFQKGLKPGLSRVEGVHSAASSMGIRDRPIASRSPWQNGYVERSIGSIRRECLDHVIIWGEAHLRQVLQAYTAYYNATRTHLGIDKDAPNRRPIESCGIIVANAVLGGLHHRYARI